jgi:hypothetical protein
VYWQRFQADDAKPNFPESPFSRVYTKNPYLNRKGQLDKTKLQVFKYWARVRGQITVIKTVVVPREAG